MVLCCLFLPVTAFGDVSPYICSYYIYDVDFPKQTNTLGDGYQNLGHLFLRYFRNQLNLLDTVLVKRLLN